MGSWGWVQAKSEAETNFELFYFCLGFFRVIMFFVFISIYIDIPNFWKQTQQSCCQFKDCDSYKKGYYRCRNSSHASCILIHSFLNEKLLNQTEKCEFSFWIMQNPIKFTSTFVVGVVNASSANYVLFSVLDIIFVRFGPHLVCVVLSIPLVNYMM